MCSCQNNEIEKRLNQIVAQLFSHVHAMPRKENVPYGHGVGKIKSTKFSFKTRCGVQYVAADLPPLTFYLAFVCLYVYIRWMNKAAPKSRKAEKHII